MTAISNEIAKQSSGSVEKEDGWLFNVSQQQGYNLSRYIYNLSSQSYNWSSNVTDYNEADNGHYYSGYYILSQPHEVLALALSCIAISLNVLSLMAISQIKNRITTHLRLIISLCMSDILIGLSVCLSSLNTALNPYNDNGSSESRLLAMCFYMFTKALNSTGLNISLLNLTMMAVDHFIAIIWPLQYPLQMRVSRSSLIIAILWFVAILLGFSDFFTGWNTYFTKYNMNYCESVYLSLYQDEYTVFVTAALTSVIMMYIYIRIYIKIRSHQPPGENVTSQQQKKRNSEIGRNKRALITTLLILGTFLICWMPMCTYQIALIIQLHIDMNSLKNVLNILVVFDKYLYNLLLVNSIADPIIYAVRMYDVQLGYRRMVVNCFPCLQKHRNNNMSLHTWDKTLSRGNNSLSPSGSSRSGQSNNGNRKYSNSDYVTVSKQ